MGVLAEVTGLAGCLAKYKRMGEYAPRELKNAMRRVGTLKSRAIKAAMKRRRLGLLYRSIGSKTKDSKGGRIVDVAGPRRGFKMTLQSVQAKLKAGRLGTVSRDKDTGKAELAVAGKFEKSGKAFKATTTDNVWSHRTRGKNKGKAYTIDPVRYAHLANAGHARGKGRSAAKKGQHFMEAADQATRPEIQAEIAGALASIGRA